MLEAVKKYAVFSGRARRREYWMFVLLCFLLSVAGLILDFTFGTIKEDGGVGPIGLLISLGLFIPSISVSVRRLHDTDRSAWWLLLCFLPILGGLILLVFFCIDGTAGDNRFGPNPKAVSVS